MSDLYSRDVNLRNPFNTSREFSGLYVQNSLMADVSDTVLRHDMGYRLKAIREVKHLTQDALAAAMGVGASTVASWESGRNQIDILKLARASKTFGFTTDWIILGDIAGLRFDDAVKIQAYMRANAQVTPRDARKRGRPPKMKVPETQPFPSVRDVPDATHPAPKGLHEPPAEFPPTRKNHVT